MKLAIAYCRNWQYWGSDWQFQLGRGLDRYYCPALASGRKGLPRLLPSSLLITVLLDVLPLLKHTLCKEEETVVHWG